MYDFFFGNVRIKSPFTTTKKGRGEWKEKKELPFGISFWWKFSVKQKTPECCFTFFFFHVIFSSSSLGDLQHGFQLERRSVVNREPIESPH
jgi:hypothetical protein